MALKGPWVHFIHATCDKFCLNETPHLKTVTRLKFSFLFRSRDIFYCVSPKFIALVQTHKEILR